MAFAFDAFTFVVSAVTGLASEPQPASAVSKAKPQQVRPARSIQNCGEESNMARAFLRA